jgi:hypothetical protein
MKQLLRETVKKTKPICKNAKTNLNPCSEMTYEEICPLRRPEKQTQSNPIYIKRPSKWPPAQPGNQLQKIPSVLKMGRTMLLCEKYSGKTFKTVRLKQSNGWGGRAVSSDIFDCSDYHTLHLLSDTRCTESLLENADKVLKKEAQDCVVVKKLAADDGLITVVLKYRCLRGGLREFVRSFGSPRSLRNFNVALELLRRGVAVAMPLAALYRKRNLSVRQSIYITEYIQDATDLYGFASTAMTDVVANQFSARKQICLRLAEILAGLHRNGFWHRDAKASNFVVRQNREGGYEIFLTDMDGIKRYGLRRTMQRFRAMWHLGASLLNIPAVGRTDYLRTFTAYCELTGVAAGRRRRLFREIAAKAKVKYHLGVLKTLNE